VNYRVDVSEIATASLLVYQEQAYFEQLCAQCPNYAANHGCPPFDFSPRDYIRQFDFVSVVRLKVDTVAMLEKYPAISGGLVEQGRQLIDLVRGATDRTLMAMEQAFAGARVSLPGACNVCATCTRKAGLPCELGQPRYSLEALGINLAGLAKELFGEEILWIKDGKLPEYFSLICGVFSVGDGLRDSIHRKLSGTGQ
jgi:predicted metal-binding protein